MRKLFAGLAVALALAIGSAAGIAAATPGGGGETPVTLCHATASASNPYVVITVDAASAGGQAQLEGHASHTGPIFDPATNVSGDDWGDIIPAYSYVVAHGPDAGQTVTYPGMNLSDEGLAILGNGCALPEGSPTPTPTPTETSPPPVPHPAGAITLVAPTCDARRAALTLANTGDADLTFDVQVEALTGGEESGTLAVGDSRTFRFAVDGSASVFASLTFEGQTVKELSTAVDAATGCGSTPPPPVNPPPTRHAPAPKVTTSRFFGDPLINITCSGDARFRITGGDEVLRFRGSRLVRRYHVYPGDTLRVFVNGVLRVSKVAP